MLAVDTNVVVRYIVGDEPRQASQARATVDGAAIFVPATVLIEADWVLRSSYRFPREASVNALRAFCGLPTVNLDRPPMIIRAFDRAKHGMDFADALHLSSASHCSAMVSFDADLAKIAKKLGTVHVRRP